MRTRSQGAARLVRHKGLGWSLGLPPWLLAVLLVAHALLALHQVDRIEFFGEDEATTAVDAARTVVGLKQFGPRSVEPLELAAHPPLRYVVLLPSLALFGFTQRALYGANVIASVLVFYLTLRIGGTFLSRAGLVFLSIIYFVSAAYGINRSLIGAGWFITFLLVAFYASERYCERGDRRWLTTAWIALTLGVLTYLEGVLFAPYVLIRTWRAPAGAATNRRRDAIAVPLIAFVLPLALYVAVFWLRPLLNARSPVGPLQHVLGRLPQTTSAAGLADWLRTYVGTFSPAWLMLIVPGLGLALCRPFHVPPILGRLTAFYAFHAVCWWFFLRPACGHTVHHYPLAMLIGAYGLQDVHERTAVSRTRYAFRTGVAVLAVTSLAYSYRVFTSPHPLKWPVGGVLALDEAGGVPCGVNDAHQIGLKSAAYVLRRHSVATDGLLTNVGGGMSEYLLGRRALNLDQRSLQRALDATSASETHRRHGVRFVALTPIGDVDPVLFTALRRRGRPAVKVLRADGGPSLFVWDLASDRSVPTVLRVGELDAAFDREFGSVEARFGSRR